MGSAAPRIVKLPDDDHCLATLTGLEPATSAVTGRRSNQLSYRAKVNVSNRNLYVLEPGHSHDAISLTLAGHASLPGSLFLLMRRIDDSCESWCAPRGSNPEPPE